MNGYLEKKDHEADPENIAEVEEDLIKLGNENWNDIVLDRGKWRDIMITGQEKKKNRYSYRQLYIYRYTQCRSYN